MQEGLIETDGPCFKANEHCSAMHRLCNATHGHDNDAHEHGNETHELDNEDDEHDIATPAHSPRPSPFARNALIAVSPQSSAGGITTASPPTAILPPT